MRSKEIEVVVNQIEILEEIRQNVGNREATSYRKSGCRISMANIPSERVILDVDLASPPASASTNQCDYVLFYIDDIQDILVGVPMELKSGGVKASDVLAQLQEGARIVDDFTPKNIKIDLIPILVHNGLDKTQYDQLRTSRINFRSDNFTINTTTCGYHGNIAEAIKKSIKR